MALSKHQSKKGQVLPIAREGEKVLTFLGPVVQEAECVRVVVEGSEVKYLVRYKSQAVKGMGTGVGVSGASQGAGAYSYAPPKSSSSSATSTGSESGLGGASGSPCHSGASSSSAVPSTSYAVGGPSGAGPVAASSISEPLGATACWDYEWVPESRVLRCGSSIEKDSDDDDDDGGEQEDDSSTSSSGACGEASDVGEGSSNGEGEGGGQGGAEGEGDGPRGGAGALPLLKPGGPGARQKLYLKRQEVKVTLPDALKLLLVKDWELVTHGKKLFNLPAEKSVDAILAEYSIFQQNSGVLAKYYAAYELVAGIKEYFNVMLGTQLLYTFERPQYAEILASHPNMRMSQIYGGAHLLRLFVQLGSVLAYTPLDDSSLNLLLGHLQDFLKYLAANPSGLFTAADYQVASAEYQQRAE